MPTLSLAISSREAKAGAQEFASAAEMASKAAQGLDQSISGVDKAANKAGPAVGNFGRSLAGLVSAYAIERFAKGAIDEFAKFETKINSIATTLDASTMKFIPRYKAGIQELALQYGESTDSLANGLYEILSAAIDAEQGLYVLEEATKAARAGVTSTAVAVDAFTTILNSYNLKASETGRVSDILYAAVLRGKMTFEELASTVGHVAAISASSNLTLEEMGAALATMTRAGLSADIAVTALKAILSTFLAPTVENIAAARQFGIELNTDTIAAEGLSGVVMKLTNASTEQVSAIFSSVRALTGMAALLKQVEGYQEDLRISTNSAGMANEAFSKTSDSVQVAMDKMSESWKRFKRDVVEPSAPAIKNLADAFDYLGPKARWVIELFNKGLTEDVPWYYNEVALNVKKAELSFREFRAAVDKATGGAWKGDLDKIKELRSEVEALNNVRTSWGSKEFLFSKDEMEALGVTDDTLAHINNTLQNGSVQLREYAAAMDELRGWKTPDAPKAAKMEPPSPALIQALGSLNVALEDVNKSIADFGKKDWEKSLDKLKSSATNLKGNELEQFNKQLQALISKYRELDALEEGEKSKEKMKQEAEQSAERLQNIQDETRELKVQHEMLGKSNAEREKAMAILQAEKDVRDSAGKPNEKELRDAIENRKKEAIALAQARGELDKLNELKQKEIELENRRQSSRAYAKDMLADIELERKTLLMTDEERERAIRLYDMERVTKNLDANESKELIAQYNKEIDELQKMDKMKKVMEITGEAVHDLFMAPLDAMMDSTKSFKEQMDDMLKDIANDMIRKLYEEFVANEAKKMVMNAFASMFNSGGAAYNGQAFSGPVTAHDNGDVVYQPSTFTSGNNAGTMSEREPEAIMPLRRDAAGRLGVSAPEGGSSRVTVNSPVKVINVLDPSTLSSYLDTEAGERQIINLVKKNRQSLGD